MEHKDEILSTRVGYLGSSDANMVASIAKNEVINPSNKKRLATLLGLEQVYDFSSYATNLGNKLENDIYNCLLPQFPTLQSNPRIESEIYCHRNFKVMTHIDYLFEDDSQVIFIENKATKDEFKTVLRKYNNQLFWHRELMIQYAKTKNKTCKLLLSHYSTLDFNGEFNSDDFRIEDVTDLISPFDMGKGLDIIDKELDSFIYNKLEEINFDYLPERVQDYTKLIGEKLTEIKSLEKDVEHFKSQMLDLMTLHNVNSLKTPYFSITKVDASIQNKFDSTLFIAENPEVYQKYVKQIKRKSYLLIKL